MLARSSNHFSCSQLSEVRSKEFITPNLRQNLGLNPAIKNNCNIARLGNNHAIHAEIVINCTSPFIQIMTRYNITIQLTAH
jgi:hypothetical protein